MIEVQQLPFDLSGRLAQVIAVHDQHIADDVCPHDQVPGKVLVPVEK